MKWKNKNRQPSLHEEFAMLSKFKSTQYDENKIDDSRGLYKNRWAGQGPYVRSSRFSFIFNDSKKL